MIWALKLMLLLLQTKKGCPILHPMFFVAALKVAVWIIKIFCFLSFSKLFLLILLKSKKNSENSEKLSIILRMLAFQSIKRVFLWKSDTKGKMEHIINHIKKWNIEMEHRSVPWNKEEETSLSVMYIINC